MIAILKSLFVLCFYHILAYGGVIYPDNANPVQMERTNDGATSSYSFYMSLSTRLPANYGIIKIMFPISTFTDPSMNPTLSSSDFGQFSFIQTQNNQVTLYQNQLYQYQDGTLTSNYLSATWNQVGRYLLISSISDAINAGSLQVTIKFIRNPVNCANTVSGNFQIQTFINSTKIDENLSFGTVTFSSPYVLSNQNTISNDGSNLGGFVTNYKVTFSTTVTLPANTWFRMRFPYANVLGDTTCSQVDTQQTLTCQNNGDNVLIFSGISNSLSPNTYTLQVRNITNPTYTGFFNQFVLECLYPGTNNVLMLFYNSLTGITINPGQVKSVSISGNPLNMNLRIDYTILFTPTNTVPQGGKIQITFPSLAPSATDPNPRSFQLDSTCRVTSGLTPIAGQQNVNCLSSGSVLTIKNFQTFFSQQIQVLIYAVNPGRAAIYTPFIIQTFLFDKPTNQYYVIDENTNAGSVSISSVNSLTYVQIDFFTTMQNGTFSQNIPLDFRLYPNPGNELPLSNSITQHEISLQLPLLWRNKAADFTMYYQQGNSPSVTFGSEPAYYSNPSLAAKYNLQVYQFKTPSATNYVKFPAGYGLGQCDLPISISNVIMPPFGGKYQFRVLTFYGGTHYVNQPLEQDLYTMDIAIPNFNSASVTTTGTESGDQDNVIIATLVTGMQIPFEGAINFNMTTTTIFSENTSKWDTQLGQTMSITQASINVPCSIYINNDLSGFSNSQHPNARCYVFKGSQLQNVILQVRGFAYPIGAGSTFKIYVPNIQLCQDVQKQCFVTINSAYTADLSDPYILNTIYVKVVNSINPASTITPASNTINSPAPSFATPAGQSKEICLYATWDLGSSFYTTPFSTGDSIIIIFPSYRFTYWKSDVQSITYQFANGVSGSVTYINFYTTQQTYYLIQLTGNVPVGNNLQLINIKNANDIHDFGPNNNQNIVQGVQLSGKYWQKGIKTSYVSWAMSPGYMDGGILFTNLSILPNNSPSAPTRTVATDMEWQAEVVYKLDFTNCRPVPQGGQFNINIPTGTPPYLAINSNCNVQQGLVGISQLTIQSSISCQVINNSGNYVIQLSQFQNVAQQTAISVIFRATNPVKQPTSWNPGSYTITSNDSSGNVINFTSANYILPALPVAGPSIFPQEALWQSFYITDRPARQGERGYFYMQFTSPISFNSGTSTLTINFGGGIYQPTQVDNTIYNFNFQTMTGYLYCTLNGEIAENCTINQQVVTMTIPFTSTINGIQANIQYNLQMGFRGNDDSTSTRDGFAMSQAGTYILSASITDGSNTVSTQKAYNVMAPSFVNFWVWSINKLVTDSSDNKCFGGGLTICGRTVVAFVFSLVNPIPPSLVPTVSQTVIILEFATYISTAFPNGFASDLGTGLPQRSNVPCEGMNIPVLAGYDTLSCQLYLGTSPNPAQIIIRQFDTIPAGSYEIHIPNIFNPSIPKDLLQVDVLVQTTSLSTGTTVPIYQNYYQLVNMTNVIQSYLFHSQPINQDLTGNVGCTPKFQTATTIDTLDYLNLCFYSGGFDMQGGDHVLFQLPSMWILPDIATCTPNPSDYGTYSSCYTYPSSQQVLLAFSTPAKGTVNKNSILKGSIKLKTPPYVALIPAAQHIYGYSYWRSRLVAKFQIPDFTQTLTPKTIPAANMKVTADDTIQGQLAQYTITYIVVSDIPAGGCIQIIIPIEFKNKQKENICRNAITQGSDFDPYGYQFQCNLVIDPSPTVNDYLLVHDFGPFKLDLGALPSQKRNGTTLMVNFRVQNPAVANPSQWTIKQWYKNESPLNLLVAVGNTNSPALSAPPTISYWEQLLLTRTKLYTQDFGVLEFKIQVPVNLNAGQTVTIQMPTGFTQQTDSQLFCYWDLTVYYNQKYPAHTCTLSGGNLLTIETPLQTYIDLYNVAQGGSAGQPIAANSYLVIGVSTIDQYNGNNGIVMPSTSGFYSFTITFPGSSQPYVATKKIYVPLKPTFTYFAPTTIINNPNEKTVIDIYVQPSIPCDNFKLYVPVVDQFNNDLFDEDLGTGFTSQAGGTPINCQYQNGAVQAALTCTLQFGDKGLGTPAIISISGITFNAGTSYLISIDQIKNPNVLVDGRDVYLILEGFIGSTIQSSDINYDFTFKYVNTPAATNVASQPAYGSVVMGGTGAGPKEFNINYQFTIQQKVFAAQSNPENYDYFIIEFPFYAFNQQPLTVSCSPGSCRQLQGWNWVIWKYDSNYSVGATISLTVSGLQNVKISSTTVQLIGYTVKNRVVVDKRYFTALNQVTPISPSAGDFTITAPDYTNILKVPQNQMTRYIFQLKLPIALQANQGVIDFIFPSGYTTQNYCSDTLAYPFPAYQDYITCVNSQVAQAVSISGFGNVPVGQIIQIEAWAANPSTATATPTFTVNIYQDAGRTMKLTTFSATGPAISAYDSTVFAKHQAEYINSIKQNSYGEFNFYLQPGMALSETDYIQLSFPNSDVKAQGQTYLVCGFNNNNINIESALCKVTQSLPLTIRIYGPVDSPLTANTLYLVYVTIENGAQQGLQFTGVGETKFQVTNSNNLGTLTDVYFTIYPTANFNTLATLETTYENSGSVIDLIVTVQTTVQVPNNGYIVVAFPKLAEDGVTTLFDDYLGKTGLVPGSTVNCAGKPSGTTSYQCTINSNFRKVMVSQRLSSGLNSAYSLLINDITLPAQTASTGQISIEVYTTAQDGTMLEAFIFRNILTPYNPSVYAPSAAPQVTTNPANTGVTFSAGTLTFTTVNLGSSNMFSGNNDRIVVKLPIGFDLTSASFASYAASEYIGIGNIMIVRLANTINSGIQALQLNNVVSPPTPQSNPVMNVYVVVGGVYNYLYQFTPTLSTSTFASISLALPYYTSKVVPQVIQITFKPQQNLIGVNTVYFAVLNSPLTAPVSPRIGQSLPCSAGTDDVYCQLVTSGTYFGITISAPTIIISGMDDATTSTPRILTIYNIKEYASSASISINFSAVDRVNKYIKYTSPISVSLSADTINSSASSVANTITTLQALGNLVFKITSSDLPLYVAGTKIILFFDNFPSNTLANVNTLSATIDYDGSNANSCTTFDQVALAIICDVQQTATSQINLNMNSILLPSVYFTTATTVTYQIIGYQVSTKKAFSYITFYPQTSMTVSTLGSVSSTKITNNQIQLQFTTNLQVPATGQIYITLDSSPGTAFQFYTTTGNLFTGSYTANLSGNIITISGFSLMSAGSYNLYFAFQDQTKVPQITQIDTMQNGFKIETSTVTQTSSVSSSPGSITVNSLQIIESQTLLIQFTTQTTFTNGQIQLDFGSSITSTTFNGQIIDSTNISLQPTFVLSTQYIYIKNIGTFTAGSIKIKLFFSNNMPSQIANINTLSQYFDVVDTVGSSTLITARTFMIAQNWLALQSLQYYSSVSVGGNNVLLTFRIKLKTAISATTDQLMITFPSSIDIASMYSNKIRLKCNVKMPYQTYNRYRTYKCFFQQLTSTYLVIQGYAFSANTVYDIELIRLGDTTSQRYMWTLPSSPQVYYFTIDKTNYHAVQDTTAPTITHTDSIIMEIYSQVSPSAYFQNYDGSVSKNTLYNVQFNSGGSFGYIDIEFPINQDQGASQVSLFAQDLGSGLLNGKSFTCNDNAGNLGTNVKYRLFYGQSTIQNSSKIRILYSASGNININIQNLINPSTVNVSTRIRVKAGSGTALSSMQVFRYAVYTLSYSPATATLPTPSFSPATASTLVTININGLSLTNNLSIDGSSILRFSYDPLQYSSTMSSSNSNPNFLTVSQIYFCITSASLPSNYNLAINNIYTPPIIGTYTYSSYIVTEIRNRKVRKVFTGNVNQALSAGGNFVQNQQIIANSYNAGQTNVRYYLTYDLMQNQVSGNTIQVIFPSAQYTIAASLTCTIQDKNSLATISSTCSSNTSSNSFVIQLSTALKPGTSYIIKMVVNNPTAVGLTNNFQMKFYTDNTLATLQGQQNVNGVTIINQLILIARMYQPHTNVYFCQSLDTCPLKFTAKLTNALNMGVDSLQIATSYIGTVIKLQSQTKELQCWINELAAYNCYINNNIIYIFAPIQTTFATGTILNVDIRSWRDQRWQGTQNAIRDFQLIPTWTQYQTTPSNFQNVPINQYTGASQSYIFKKNWIFVNQAFNRNNYAFACSISTTINNPTIIRVRFQLPNSMSFPDALPTTANWGQFILYLETYNEINQQLFPYNLESRFIKDGQQIDCICVNCNSNMKFLCYIQYGGTAQSAPASISIHPQQTTNPGTTFIFSFPKINLPPNINNYARIGLKAIQFDSTNKVVNEYLEMLMDFVFYTNPNNINNAGSIGLSFPAGHRVGDPMQVSWNYNIPQTQALLSRDRIVITTTTATNIIEQPTNPSIALTTTADVGTVRIYPLINWLEIEFTTNMPSNSKTAITYNFKNMPYQITGGVYYQLYAFSQGEERLVQPYNNIPFANPHPLFFKKFTTTVQYISQPNTVTFTYQPYNKIPIGGYISIYWGTLNAAADSDWQFLSNYCVILSGLSNAQCIVVSSQRRIYLYDWDTQYDPVVGGVIKFVLQIQNSGNAGNRVNFSLTTFWDLTGYNNRPQVPGYDPNYSHIIDQDNSYTNFNVLSIVLLQLNILDRVQEPIPVCGGNRGPIVLKFQFRKNYSYPSDYIEINFFAQIQQLLAGEELICYFADTGNAQLIFVKTFRCDLRPNGVIWAFIPEETSVNSGSEYLLYLTVRTNNVYTWGIQVNGPSAIQWTRLSTSNENQGNDYYQEVAWIQANIPPCPFDPNVFRVYSYSHEANTYSYNNNIDAQTFAEQYLYTYINVTLATVNNPIASGLLTSTSRTRIVFQFQTHNGIFPSWDEDPTGQKLTTAGAASCGGMYNGIFGTPFIPAGQNLLSCSIIPASGQLPTTPAYIIMEGHPAINAGKAFNIALGRIKNPNKIVDGTVFNNPQIGKKTYNDALPFRYQTAAHMNIIIQQLQPDGTFYPINSQWRYYIVPQWNDATPPIIMGSSQFQIQHYDTRVNFDLRNVTVNIIPLGIQLNKYQSAVVIQYGYPYQMVNNAGCKQHDAWVNQGQCSNYNPSCPVPHGPVGCTFLPQSRWLVFSNNLDTVTNQYMAREVEGTGYPYNRRNPPFTYNYLNAQSLLRAWVYDGYKTVIMRSNQYITPQQMPCGVVMETTAADNPENRDVLYRIGLYIYTRTSTMKTIWLFAPNSFQNIRSCKIKKGVVLVDFNNISNDIQCKISYQTTNWFIEITNFNYNENFEDGLIILELMITNPYNAGWTTDWVCRTFSANSLQINNLNYNANGKTWVGKFVPFPNLFRVYRNTFSFQDRRAGINQYAEMNMRIIPRAYHPETDDTQSTQIQVWMPLTYDIPNGGTDVCSVDHIYHTDIDGQYCQITSDRKIFMNTNRNVGLFNKCGLVFFTTQNSINNQNGVKMPPVAGADQFQVFITSKDTSGNVSQEYSNQGATTNPSYLSTTAYPAGNSYSYITNVMQSQIEARIILSFYTPRDIPPGYDTSVGISDPSLKNPIAYLDIMFNTRDYIEYYGSPGWNLNLVAASPINPFACKAYAGLIPQSGQKLICTIMPSTQQSIYNPVIVRVSNFQSISANTYIELHLLNIPCPPQTYYNNQGFINTRVFQQNGDGSQNDIIGSSQFTLGQSAQLINWYYWSSNMATVTPNQVGAYSTWTFFFDQMYDYQNNYQGCFDATGNPMFSFLANTILVLKIPNVKFVLVDNGQISATIANIPAKIWIYEDTNQIFVKVPQNTPCGSGGVINSLQIYQLRNAAFRFPTPYSIRIDSYDAASRTIIRTYLYTPISNPAVGSFVSLSMYLSKYFADERYVTYTYGFTPSYDVPPGSLITITLPNRAALNFPSFGQASPQETCQVSDATSLSVSSCVSTFSPNGFSIVVLKDIPEQTSLTVQIVGTRNNPSYAQQTLPNDFQVSITHPLGYLINSGYFPVITYLPKRSTSFLYLTMSGTSYFQNIITDYTFVIQSTSDLPIGGYIVMNFPSNFLERALTLPPLPTPTQIIGSWTSSSLTYSTSWSGPTGSYYTLTIIPTFMWPAKSSMTVTFKAFPNPMTTLQTNLFSIATIYDGKNVDQTDPTDNSLLFNYSPQPATMSATFSFSPKNEASLSNYQISITPSQNIPVGAQIQFQFDTSLYPSSLSSANSQVACLLNGVATTCTVQNGVVSIPVTQVLNANNPIQIQLNNIMNPSQGSTKIVGQVSYAGNILQYKPDIGPVQTTSPPNNLQLTQLSTSSNALLARAQYTFCVQTSNQIAITDQVFIFFPSQYSFKSVYTCAITPQHNNNELNYAQTSTSPLCTTYNDQRKISITGQTAAKTDTNTAQLCYYINGIENPSIPGTTDNFVIQIYDPANNVVKSQTSGLISTLTTLSFYRKGFQIIVGSIPDLPKGASSNDITITLEIAVSYFVTAIPYLKNFEFIPPVISFDPTQGKQQTFKIKPLDSAVVGPQNIVWTKSEATSTNQFSDIQDTPFNLIAKPYANSLKAVLQTTVSRAALLATSLPIQVILNQPASKVLTISMYTKNHQQDSLLVFNPPQMVFVPGQVSQTFTYTTKNGAVSGQIMFQLDSYYQNIYIMPYNTLSFEILDIDNNPPTVRNYYIESMDRTYIYLRISCDESVNVYSMLTLQGTLTPTTAELKNSTLRATDGNQTDVMELYMRNSSYVAPVTTNFIYYDSYLHFTGLEEQTSYLLYFYVEDLSGNASPVQSFNFTTLKKQNPCAFSIRVNQTIQDSTLFSAFGLITTLPASRFQITSKPSKFTITEVIETEVKDIIGTVPMVYSFILLQNKTADEVRPLQTVNLLQNEFSLLQTQLSTGFSTNVVDPTYSIIEHAYELIVIPQEFKYTPMIVNSTEDSASFIVSLKYSGIGYGIVQLASATQPTARQIKYGLNSTNFLLPKSQYQKIPFVFSSSTPQDQQNITNKFEFSGLLDHSDYVAYFIGENSQLVNPDLMSDNQIVAIPFSTSRESIKIPSWFRAETVSANLLRISKQFIQLILIIMIVS
ncbi:hypothetical protein TTHERM_000331066 (macronuclear) [Tetrahymena thermophila SB210]|uniref:Transmembrane protein n=1 Tax=Tetrahymena thermophila (strain SB210) TaxID=312017 RepID=W7X4M9_TETTS|nr:hypothetical protein TTHERM_000331066 [Tetrahymena thermophila SB210]EWS71333.1 hypothetical protein TTHERM_000331066 [Tetrahymena thermophila SB210]|eukprot:XP_012656151.1 hypothetical protein TTHERM_000331066 [Tetrahymena thermophila SB210]